MEIVVESGGLEYAVEHDNPADSIVRVLAETRKLYEAEALDAVRALGLRGTYVDVGANFGNHSMYFVNACQATTLVAVEPNPRSALLWHANMRRNCREPAEWTLWECAAGEREGLATLGADPGNNLGACTVDFGRAGDVAVRTMDYMLSGVVDPVVFVKIDVEFSECAVLRGMHETLNRYHQAMLIEAYDNMAVDLTLSAVCPGYRCVEQSLSPYCPTFMWRFA
jgi:protein O-GlcNAc transferase